MRVLNIGSDPTLFVAGSAARVRMLSYASAIGELHIISIALKGAKKEQEGNLFLYPVHTWKIFRIHALAAQAHEIILREDIEVVSAQDPFEHGLAALRAIRGTSAKLHIQVHTDFLSPWFVKREGWRLSSVRMSLLNRYRLRIADRVLPQASGIRAVSNRVRKSLIVHYGPRISEPSVIPIAVDSAVPHPVQLPKHQFAFSLIAVSRLETEKRVGDIITAVKLVTVRYPMAGLFIVGDGSERERLENMVHSCGLAGKVIFLGNRPEARALIASAQAFIQASAYEGYGVTLIEAALAKVPIITTDIGIVGEVFKKDEDILPSSIADPVAISLNIVRVLEDSAIRRRLSINADVAARSHLKMQGNIAERVRYDFRRILT